MKKSRTGATVVMMMVANFMVKFFGLLREILIAKYYGTSIYTDAYIIAHNIPTVLFAAIGSAIATTFIPMYSRACSEVDEKRANTFTLHLIEALFVICFVLTVLGEVFTDKVVYIFASGFEGETLDLTIRFAKILFPSIFGMTLFDLFGSYLQQHEKFSVYAVVPIVGNVTIIISLIISNYFGDIYIFVWGTLLGLLTQVLFYLPWVIKSGLFNGNIRSITNDGYLKDLLPLLVPVFIGAAATEINSIIDKTLVSGLEKGSVSYLNYAYKIVNLVIGVVVASITVVSYPKMARAANQIEKKGFKEISENTVMAMFAVIVPVSVLVVIFRTEIISILFQRGNFDRNSVTMTASALAYYAIGLGAMGLRDIFVKIFYCIHNTKTPMINGVVSTVCNIFLDICLIRVMQHNGAAFATSISAVIGATILFVLLGKESYLNIRVTIQSFIKTLIAGLAAYMVIELLYRNIVIKFDLGLLKIFICGLLCLAFICVYLIVQVVEKNIVSKNIIEWIKLQRKYGKK